MGEAIILMEPAIKQMCHAFWESNTTVLLILSADYKGDAESLPVELGPKAHAFAKIESLTAEAAARYTRYYLDGKEWVFQLQAKRYPQLLEAECEVYLGGDFNDWESAIGFPDWKLTAERVKGGTDERMYEVRIPSERIPLDRNSAFKFVTSTGEWLDVPEGVPNLLLTHTGVRNFKLNPTQSGQHIFRCHAPEGYQPTGNEQLVWKDASNEEVLELPHTQFLTQAETKLELGADIIDGMTRFRLFAPRASEVQVAFGERADAKDFQIMKMDKADPVTWEVFVDKELDGWFYNFRVLGCENEGTAHFDYNFPILDPYAKACCGPTGPGIILKDSRLLPVQVPYEPPAWHDLVILEGHVRDLAAHAPIELTTMERRGFAGVRKWLKAERSYLREIGVNAIELQPIQEFDNALAEEYHWGYMTVNYFSPDSSYAYDSRGASQVEEFKGLVQDFHDADMAVILDVVYNHVGEPNHLLFIDKYYYFHLDEANDLVNWSGCGNDLRCNTPMGRRLILESLKHLVRTYDVDGFRFDLAELMGIEVLLEIERELKAIKPSIILIAEPWSFRGHIQDTLKESGFASWNDGFRESIAEYVCGHGKQETIEYFLKGSPSTSRFAAQSINYTESHDDHCWLDRITERKANDGSDPTLLDRRRTHLMASILFGALGVPMLAAGQDLLRSKWGISNTYQRGDLNALDYNKRYVYSGTHQYFRDWIHFRLSGYGKALRFDGTVHEGYLRCFFKPDSSAVVAIFNADHSVAAPRIALGLNPSLEFADIGVPTEYLEGMRQIADAERFDLDGLQIAQVPVKGNTISLPPISSGLWILDE